MSGRSARRGSGRRRGDRHGDEAALEVTGADGVLAVHAAGQSPDHLVGVAAELRQGRPTDHVTVLVGAGFEAPETLRARLAPALAEAHAAGARELRLVMSGAAADRPDRPAAARAFSEAGPFEVLAPRGLVVVAPGGTLFAPDLPDTPGGWWNFSSGLVPRRVGTRLPEPQWQAAVERTAPAVAGGCVVEQIPAGLLVLPTGTPPEGASALRYAVPPDAAGPLLVVGSSRTATVPADALAEVIAALPAQVRGTVRLVPGGGADLLPVGRHVADLLGIPVQVLSGLPLLLDDPERADDRGRAGTPRVVLTDETGEPSWRPYVETVTCVPSDGGAAPAPRLGTWRPPVSGLRPGLEPGAMMLDRKWEVVVTRAGLWIGPNGLAVPEDIAARPVLPELMTVDVGVPGEPLDDSVWEPLDRLFTALQDDVRERTLVQLQGDGSDDDLRAVRRLAVVHGLAVAPRGWQGAAGTSAAAEPAVAPGPVVRPDFALQAEPAEEPAENVRPENVRPEHVRPEPAVSPAAGQQPGPGTGSGTAQHHEPKQEHEPEPEQKAAPGGAAGGALRLVAEPVPRPPAVTVTFTPPAATPPPPPAQQPGAHGEMSSSPG